MHSLTARTTLTLSVTDATSTFVFEIFSSITYHTATVECGKRRVRQLHRRYSLLLKTCSDAAKAVEERHQRPGT
jgi:hypothetical protein